MSIRNKVIQVSDFYEDREENLSTRQRRVDKDLGFNENSLISDLVVDPRKEKAIQANSYVARRVIMKFIQGHVTHIRFIPHPFKIFQMLLIYLLLQIRLHIQHGNIWLAYLLVPMPQ